MDQSRSSFSGNSANLDLIRAVAVLCVFFAHVRDHFILGAHSTWDWRFGQLGVLIFFVHTSFVLMLSLERSRYRGAAFLFSFYLRRFFRLYPLSILFVAGVYLFGEAHWTPAQLLSNLALTFDLTYTQPMWGVMWTLAVEMQMYLVLPALFLFCVKRRPLWAIALWVIALPIAYLQPLITDRLDVLTYVPSFMGGVIAWRLSRDLPRKLPAWAWPLAFAAATLVWLSTTRADQAFHRWLFGLCLGLAIPFFRELAYPGLVRAAHEIAKYSYGIYLSHPAAISLALALPLPLAGKWAVLVLCAAGAPVALYHLVERPMIDLGQRLSARVFRARATAAAIPLAG